MEPKRAVNSERLLKSARETGDNTPKAPGETTRERGRKLAKLQRLSRPGKGVHRESAN